MSSATLAAFAPHFFRLLSCVLGSASSWQIRRAASTRLLRGCCVGVVMTALPARSRDGRWLIMLMSLVVKPSADTRQALKVLILRCQMKLTMRIQPVMPVNCIRGCTRLQAIVR